MLNKTQKEKIVEDIANKFKRQKIAILSDFRGISVSKLQALRRLLKKGETEYKIAKKTLFDRALEKAGINLKTKGKFDGELGIALSYADTTTPAKTLLKFSKENETFKILGGILNGRILSDKEVVVIAKLPPREILIAQLLGTLQSPMRGLATVLQGNIRGLVVILNKIKDRK